MRPINEALIGTYIGTAADIGGYARQWAAVTYGLAGALAVSAVPGVAGAVVAFRAGPGGGNGQRMPL